MSALPNPLQELAEKLIERIHVDFDDEIYLGRIQEKKDLVEFIVPILTASVGTLLQAERAATIKECAQIAKDEWDLDQNHIGHPCFVKKYGTVDVDEAILKLATPEAASALSAVVQRETAKLRELLKWALSDECDSSMAEFEAKKAAALEAIK